MSGVVNGLSKHVANQHVLETNSKKRHSGRPKTAGENAKRALKKEAHKISKRITEINATLAVDEGRITQLEKFFSDPVELENRAEVVVLGEEYEALKTGARSLWEEWEELTLKADAIERLISDTETNNHAHLASGNA